MREILICLILLKLSSESHIYRPSFFNEDELNHHVRFEREDGVSSSSGGSKPCDEDNLMNFLAEIQVINPESIVKLATFSEIEPSCRKVSDNLEKIKNYLKGCTPPNQGDLYYQLIKGVESLHEKLCTESPFKKKFVDIHKCIHELQNDLEDCGGPADWNENSDNAAVCKAYKDIADCYYIKTAKVCGKEAASTAKELLQSVIDSILTINCANVKENPTVKDPMPDKYIKKTNKGHQAVPLSVLLLSIFTSLIMILHY